MNLNKTLCKQCKECREYTYIRRLKRRGNRKPRIFKFLYCQGNEEVVGLCNWGPSSPKNKDERMYVTSTKHINGKRRQFETFLKKDPDNVISYINKNPLDNRLKNLREIRKVCSTQTVIGKESIFLGVSQSSFYKHRNKKKWLARIKIGGKTEYIGLYDTELEAAHAYYSKMEEIGREINKETPAYQKYREWLVKYA